MSGAFSSSFQTYANRLTSSVGITVTVADPDTPSAVAVITLVPSATGVMTPVVALTVATVVVADVYVMVRPERTELSAARVTTVDETVAPRTTGPAIVTLTTETGRTVTVTDAVPETPPIVAVIVAVPSPTPVTSPALLTEAIVVLLVDHSAVGGVAQPFVVGFADNDRVAATKIDCIGGLTATALVVQTATGLEIPEPSPQAFRRTASRERLLTCQIMPFLRGCMR